MINGDGGSQCSKIPPPPRVITASLLAISTEWSFGFWDDWMFVSDGETLQAELDVQNVTGGFVASMAVQYATIRTKRPSAPEVIGSAANTPVLVQVALDTETRIAARVGLAWRTTNTAGSGTVVATSYVSRFARPIGSLDVEVGPMVANATRYLRMGRPETTLGLGGYKGAALITGFTGTGTLTYGLVARRYALDRETPSPWVALETPVSVTADSARNTGLLALPTNYATSNLGELALAIESSAAGVSATVKVVAVGHWP